jgi:hypothetical protein
MTSLSDISVVPVPSPEDGASGVRASNGAFAPFEAPTGRSPVVLAVLAVLAGIGAMALGTLAVLTAATVGDDGATPALVPTRPALPGSSPPAAERRVLALLAKPSTERVAFRGSGGRLVLAVGSGGRAAILRRGVARPSTVPLVVWVLRGGGPVRAGRLTGSARAVFLAVPVGRGHSVVVGVDRAAALRPGPARISATRS